MTIVYLYINIVVILVPIRTCSIVQHNIICAFYRTVIMVHGLQICHLWSCEHYKHCTVLDSRTKGWWMVNSVFTTLTITICYLLVVWLTPRCMQSRPAYSLKNVLIVYNVLMILVNVFIITEVRKKVVPTYSQ